MDTQEEVAVHMYSLDGVQRGNYFGELFSGNVMDVREFLELERLQVRMKLL